MKPIEKVPMMEFISTGFHLHVKIENELLFAQFLLEHARFVPIKNFQMKNLSVSKENLLKLSGIQNE